MDASPTPVLVLFGPTASGKTNVLLRLFKGGLDRHEAEVVSADSMQVYRGMDIGTAKPSAQEREQLPHHLIDIRSPNEPFNAGDFVRLANEAIAGIAQRGAFPVVCGGTGFYLKNLIMGLPESPPADAAIRAALKSELHEKGAAALMEELAQGDPVSAERIHLNDVYRLLRALEVLRLSGRPLSSFGVSGQNPVSNLTTEDTEFHGGKMIFVLKTPSCPQDSNPPCTPWFFILILARMVSVTLLKNMGSFIETVAKYIDKIITI